MSKAASSPTARLLQSSRLFSLPRPLPLQPELSTGVYRASESATTPYPTLQAITTPAPSHHRGDWGLKRAIPNRKTESSTPVIRVRANDTYEHITDFMSAGDHVQTERKWTEMGVPLVTRFNNRGQRSSSQDASLSVFEEWLDNTDPHAKAGTRRAVGGRVQREEAPKQMKRWKYQGPYLAGMQDGEFEQWLQRSIVRSPKREEWRTFLRAKWTEKQLEEAKRRARDINEPLDEEQIATLETRLQPSDRQISAYEKELRDDHYSAGLSSDLTAHICEFLDLPSVFSPSSSSRINPLSALATINDDTDDSAPATTHPSAGLGHLRTDAFLHNHPLYGPQRDKSPVEARVVRPRTQSGAQLQPKAQLGVGGIVSEDSRSATVSAQDNYRPSAQEERMAHSLDENKEGGNRLWVLPEKAFIDAKSRVQLATTRARPEAVAVKTGDLDAIKEISESKSAGVAPRRADLAAGRRASTRSSSAWGVGTRDSSRAADDLFNSVGR